MPSDEELAAMEVVQTVSQFICPGCAAVLQPGPEVHVLCPACQWTGQAYLFQPVATRVDLAETALPDDAVCAHHPGKRAVAVCAGTGDFICALCAIDVGG